jgi:hypothetical protein
MEERLARRRDLYLTTHNTHKTDILAAGGIRTRNLSKRASADPRLDRAATEIKSAKLRLSANMKDISKLHFFQLSTDVIFSTSKTLCSIFTQRQPGGPAVKVRLNLYDLRLVDDKLSY